MYPRTSFDTREFAQSSRQPSHPARAGKKLGNAKASKTPPKKSSSKK